MSRGKHSISPQVEMVQENLEWSLYSQFLSPVLTFTLVALLPHGRLPAPLIVSSTTAITCLPTGVVLAFTTKPGHGVKHISVIEKFCSRSFVPVQKTDSNHGHPWYHLFSNYENKALCIYYPSRLQGGDGLIINKHILAS